MSIRGVPMGGDKWNRASFFLPKSRERKSLQELQGTMTQAGVVDVHTTDRPSFEEFGAVQVVGRWADTGIQVIGQFQELEKHELFRLQFYWSEFLARMPETPTDVPLEQDPGLDLAKAFARSCEGLQPRAAVLHVQAYAGFDVEAREVEPFLTAQNVNKLVGAISIAMLYLDDELADALDRLGWYDVDTLPVSRGRLMFHGTGARRWS